VRKPGGSTHRSFVFYGRSNTGKTTLFSSFASLGKVLLLNMKDNGDDSVSNVRGLMVRDIEDWDDLEETYWWLYKNPTAYKAIGLDTVSQMQGLALEKVMGGKARHPKMKGKALGDFGSMSRKEWGMVASLMKDWLTRFRDLPCEVVFLAQDRTSKDEEAEADEIITPSVGPALSPSVASHLNASVHVIGNTFIRQRIVKTKVKDKAAVKTIQKKVTEYCLRLAPDPVYVTKVRKPKDIILPSVLVDPTYERLMAIVNATLTGDAS